MQDATISTDQAAPVFEAFGLPDAALRPDLFIPGSPERCLARAVAEDREGGLWVLERLFLGQQARREPVARVMDALSGAGLDLVPAFRPGPGGGFVYRQRDWDWQLAPYIEGETLPQPDYVRDADRGDSLAGFLTSLTRFGDDASPGLDRSFSLPIYMDNLLATLRTRRPELAAALAPVREALVPLDEAWSEMPRTLAHGDFHPLNVIWREGRAVSVIDWEFCGLRPELFDAANMLGCVGSEEPKALGSGLALAFLDGLRRGGVLRADNGRWLFSLFLGLRFAWMSEWLRRADEEMIEMETAYMRLVLNSREDLERVWGLS